ncbi:MAG: sigma-70 family RNA polymerase sigma factor [Geobacter sp.]|nr:sigma-70 family RNA polymerase sigma factor [Geobacter sp.]
MDDLEIIAKIRNGNADAYALLVEKYHRPLLTFIFRIVDDESRVEDIGQEVFFNVYKSLKDFDERKGTPFSAWLFIAARNRCASVFRERRGRKRVGLEEIAALPDGAKNAEDMLLEQERMVALDACLRQIPEPFRMTLLRSLEGESLDQIATAEGISTGTVKSRLFRAKERMRVLVREYFGGKKYEGV